MKIHVYHHFDFDDDFKEQVLGILNIHTQKLDKIMATLAEISAKADALQTALDAEQQQIADAITGLNQTITDLQALIVDGGTAAERQAVLDKLTAITSDLEDTVPDATPPVG